MVINKSADCEWMRGSVRVIGVIEKRLVRKESQSHKGLLMGKTVDNDSNWHNLTI